MKSENLKAPFPWFGGKSRMTPQVWAALGDVSNHVEEEVGAKKERKEIEMKEEKKGGKAMNDEKNRKETIKKFAEWAKKKERLLASTYKKWYKEQCKKYPTPDGRKVPGKSYQELEPYSMYLPGLFDGFPYMGIYYILPDHRLLPELRGNAWGQCYRHEICYMDDSVDKPIPVAYIEECHRDKLTIRILPVEDVTTQ